jgi:hypothetical protein
MLAVLLQKYAEDGASQIAQVYAVRGEVDRAFEWLEHAYRQRDPGLASIKSSPHLRSLASDPRWSSFLLKMGFDA